MLEWIVELIVECDAVMESNSGVRAMSGIVNFAGSDGK
jgi:hypothetical protein